MLRKSMYMCANFNVSLLDNLSDGLVGTIWRSLENASFRLCVLCLSRTFAAKENLRFKPTIQLSKNLYLHSVACQLLLDLKVVSASELLAWTVLRLIHRNQNVLSFRCCQSYFFFLIC